MDVNSNSGSLTGKVDLSASTPGTYSIAIGGYQHPTDSACIATSQNGLASADRMFDKDGNQIEVVSVQDNFLGSEATFYSLDVEDVDTYFSSDILVHNLPKK